MTEPEKTCPFKPGDAVIVGADPNGYRPVPLRAVVLLVEKRRKWTGYDTEVLEGVGGGPWDGWLLRLRFEEPLPPNPTHDEASEAWFGWEWLTRA